MLDMKTWGAASLAPALPGVSGVGLWHVKSQKLNFCFFLKEKQKADWYFGPGTLPKLAAYAYHVVHSWAVWRNATQGWNPQQNYGCDVLAALRKDYQYDRKM